MPTACRMPRPATRRSSSSETPSAMPSCAGAPRRSPTCASCRPATASNMRPENGATMGFFPVDAQTLRYLRLTGRDEAQVALVEAYCKAQGLWRDAHTPPAEFTGIIEIDLSAVEPSVSGPSRPQDRVPLGQAPAAFRNF